MIQREGVKIILKSPYFDPKAAQFVAEKTGARIVNMVHQVGALEGADDYIAMVNYNVQHLVGALRGN